jgi:MFS family permease
MSQMSATGSAYAEDGFRVGRVLGRSFGVLGRHFVQFLLVTIIPLAPLAYVMGVEVVSFVGVKHPDPAASVRIGLLMMAAVAFWGLAMMIAQAIVLYGTFQDMRGKPMRFGEAIVKGFARFFPILGLAICSLIAVGAGFVLLIIPGIIFGVMFYVALPACVVERLGPIASMKRSIALTKGHRWKIFGILILIGLLSGIGGAVIATILTIAGGAKTMLIGRFLWQAIMGAFGAVVVAVIYHDLRAAREGIDVDRMAAVFD